jgi:hypothetical protein
VPLIFLLGFVVIGLWSTVAHRFDAPGSPVRPCSLSPVPCSCSST